MQSGSLDLEAGEELVGVLVLAHVDGLAVIVLECLPEAARPVEMLMAERQVDEDCLHHPHNL